ncbi:MAG: response regulator [Anaerolineaceae bacterium]|jgi:pilus assembly protein CpaE
MPGQGKIQVVVVDDTDDSREMILRMLQFDPTIEVVGTARTGIEAIASAQKLKPDVIVMDINMPDMDGITATENIRKRVPFIQVVILSVQSDPNYMRRAMLAGARDFLTKPPMIDELTSAIRRAAVLAQEERAKEAAVATGLTGQLGGGRTPGVNGKVIVVYSPKGGTGSTMLATNLACSLKTTDNSVALVDSNFLFGDVGVFLNEHTKNSSLDLIDRVNDLDADIMNDVMTVNKQTGLHLLAAPNQPELVDVGYGEPFAKILTFMRQIYHFVIVDTTSYLTEVGQSCLDIADLIILITTQDIPAIKNTNQFLTIADASKIERKRILLVMNRYDKKVAISPERVGASLKQPVVVAIPFEERIITNSINRGMPFMVDNKIAPAAKSIQQLTELVKTTIQEQVEFS